MAIYEYTPNRADELWIRPNDVITVLYQDNENWWMGELPDGRQGYFPVNYVMDHGELYEPQSLQRFYSIEILLLIVLFQVPEFYLDVGYVGGNLFSHLRGGQVREDNRLMKWDTQCY